MVDRHDDERDPRPRPRRWRGHRDEKPPQPNYTVNSGRGNGPQAYRDSMSDAQRLEMLDLKLGMRLDELSEAHGI